MRKKLSFILVLVLLANLLLSGISLASEVNNSVVPSELSNVDNGQTLLTPDTFQWGNQAVTPQTNGGLSNQENNNEEGIANQILEGIDKSNSQTGEENQAQAAVVAVYFIPGIGEVAILATGAVVVGTAVYKAGSWVYNTVKNYLAKAEKEKVDVSGRSGWTKTKGESDVLNKVNGKKGKTGKGTDGTIKTDVLDKKTGKKIGEIHKKQPEDKIINGKKRYTGRKYPDHYHDYVNKLGKGDKHHWYW